MGKNSKQSYLEILNSKLNLVRKSTYHRQQFQTHMSAFEWKNVELSENLGEFLKEGNTFFHFPFIKQTVGLWKITFNSILAARKHNSIYSIMNSEYGVMAGFISIFTGLEFIPKGIIALVLRPFFSKKNQTEMQEHFANYFQKYAKDLQTIPFYDQDYKEARAQLKTAYQNADSKTWADAFGYYLITCDLLARQFISKPLHKWFHDEANIVSATTDAIVKYKSKITNLDEAKSEFRNKISKIQVHSKSEIVEDHVYARKKDGKDYVSIYALLHTPRYKDFINTTKVLNQENIHLKKIAGNDYIQVKCFIDADNIKVLQKELNELKEIKNIKPLYTYGDDVHSNRQLFLFDVPVKKLQQVVCELENKNDVEVRFIHNF